MKKPEAQRQNQLKSIDDINRKIESRKAVVMTAEEVIAYVERKGLQEAAREIDVVTTATFGPMCSSGVFMNLGHSKPKIRITQAWIDDVEVYSGIAAVDLYLGATQLQVNDPANLYYPGEFRFGGGHVIEKLVRGEKVQLYARSYGTDEYPLRELRSEFSLAEINQAIMTNPRNCYQNYNAAVNSSDKLIHTYLGALKPAYGSLGYSSAGQLSPLLNDPWYRSIGIGSKVWLAGAPGIVYAPGTQHSPDAPRGDTGVPVDGAGTLGLTGDLKQMDPEFVRGVSIRGYGVSLALGVAIPIPITGPEVLKGCTVRDEDIMAPVIDYAVDYPKNTGKVLTHVSYADLRRGEVRLFGRSVETGSLSSYAKALKAANLLADQIRAGDFTVNTPAAPLPATGSSSPMPAALQGVR
ncbi:homocysteine biosynthesis protein [Marispirochaeta aestuarii]|uniref:homocysteine biosynthesis protein n=1 Tax=Marispirochaeta aestuarii TaxID=1963862 RepID=UPI001E4EE093|nr:homocysteine biosynthesis protein [Marispirochaeta aestuarii]